MPPSRSSQNDADDAFNLAWDKIQRRKGRKRPDSNESADDPPPSQPGGPQSPLPSPFSPLPNINPPSPRIPPSRHSTEDSLPDISDSHPAEANDSQQHFGPETLNTQKVVVSLSTLVDGFVDCLQTARDISIVVFKTIYFLFPGFIIRWTIKIIFVSLIILNTLMFASESIRRGFCHIAPQAATPLLATALTDMAMCAVPTQAAAPSMNSDETLDGFVPMIPPVWDFLSKNSEMISREFSAGELSTYIKEDFETFDAGFRDAAREMQNLEDDFTEKQKHHWNAINDFIFKFNNIPPDAVWYRFLDSKLYDAKAHCMRLISILKGARNHTLQALASIPADKSTGIYSELFNLEAMGFYDSFREAFMQTSSGAPGVSAVYDHVINSWTVGTKTSGFLANQLVKRKEMLKKDEAWLGGKITTLRRRQEELELGRGQERRESWHSKVESINESFEDLAKEWRRKLKRYFVEEIVDMD